MSVKTVRFKQLTILRSVAFGDPEIQTATDNGPSAFCLAFFSLKDLVKFSFLLDFRDVERIRVMFDLVSDGRKASPSMTSYDQVLVRRKKDEVFEVQVPSAFKTANLHWRAVFELGAAHPKFVRSAQPKPDGPRWNQLLKLWSKPRKDNKDFPVPDAPREDFCLVHLSLLGASVTCWISLFAWQTLVHHMSCGSHAEGMYTSLPPFLWNSWAEAHRKNVEPAAFIPVLAERSLIKSDSQNRFRILYAELITDSDLCGPFKDGFLRLTENDPSVKDVENEKPPVDTPLSPVVEEGMLPQKTGGLLWHLNEVRYKAEDDSWDKLCSLLEKAAVAYKDQLTLCPEEDFVSADVVPYLKERLRAEEGISSSKWPSENGKWLVHFPVGPRPQK